MTVETLLQRICESSELEADWLDLLSQLEYVGFRKITKGVPFDSVSLSVLHHIVEEASHAFLLKGLADKRLGGRSWSDSPLKEMGWRYFQTLDREVSSLSELPSYSLVSWVVEQRVLLLYPLYLGATQCKDVKSTLRRILAQEQRHGAQFDSQEFEPSLQDKASQIEARLWAQFLSDLTQWVCRKTDVKHRHAESSAIDSTSLQSHLN